MSVLDELKKLDAQREQLLSKAKDDALERAQKAVSELNELGFNYRLVDSSAPARPAATAPRGSRRSGIRTTVLEAIQNSTGMSRADLLEHLNVKGDKAGEQSVSNALAALKKAGQIDNRDGTYHVIEPQE